jgi:LemA protein
VRVFPNNLTAMLFGYKTKANFTVEDEKAMSAPPAIRFDSGAKPAQSAPAETPKPAPDPLKQGY